MKSQDLRPGMAVKMDGQLFLVKSYEHVKPGKGPAYAQVKLKNLATGAHIEKRLRSGEDIEQAFLDRREMEFLYSETDNAILMDMESFEQVPVPFEDLGDRIHYFKPNLPVTALVNEGKVVDVDLPMVVDLTVSDTAPQPKGATVTNQLKEATMETGLIVRVPPFIKNGEVLKVNTETGEYVGRASGD